MAPKTGMGTFIDSLNSVQADRFVRVMGHLVSQGARGELDRLRQELKAVKMEIDNVNRERDELRIEKQDLEEICGDLDNWPSSRAHQDLVQFRYMLCNLVDDLNSRIALSRPVELHERKANIKKDIANRGLLADLAGMLKTTAAGAHGD